jgi:hypothetical protein
MPNTLSHTKTWPHIESDYGTPSVGDAWVALRPYLPSIEYKVIEVTKSRKTLRGKQFKCGGWDYYPLTAERVEHLATRNKEYEVYRQLDTALWKMSIHELTVG